MKKHVVGVLCVILLFCSTTFASKAATSVPTWSWNLVPTAYMEQIGIFTDPVNHRGIYNYPTATVNPGGAYWYSNFYFKASAPKKFYFCGYSTSNPTNQDVLVVMQNYYQSGVQYRDPRILEEHQSFFIYDYYNSVFDISDQAYFYFRIDVATGPSVSLNGDLETY